MTFDPTLPLAKAHTIPSKWYVDGAMVGLERQSVFSATWQFVGRADAVREPGQFFTFDLAGEPILVTRDEAGTLHGFFNVCRHRAAPLACQASGKTDRLRCQYHGWTYDLAGNLKGVPEFDGVQDFSRESFGLVPVQIDQFGPWIFAHLGKPKQSLLEYLHPIPTKLLSTDGLVWAERREYTLACNWKVFVDNYLDGGYHVNTIHPGLAGVLDYSQYRSELFENTNVQLSPLKPPGEHDDSSASQVRIGNEAQYWWVFPNLMINHYGNLMDTNVVLPLGPNHCNVIFDFYFGEGTIPSFIDESIAVSEKIQQEDVGICEAVQKGLASQSYSTGRFSVKREATGYHFHRLLAQQLPPASD